MESKRQKQIARLIQRSLSQVFRTELATLFGKALITISNVYITPDLSIARVYISIFNTDNADELINMLSSNTKQIRYALGKQIRHQVRKIPDLEFFMDDSLDNVFELEKIFKELKDKEKGQQP